MPVAFYPATDTERAVESLRPALMTVWKSCSVTQRERARNEAMRSSATIAGNPSTAFPKEPPDAPSADRSERRRAHIASKGPVAPLRPENEQLRSWPRPRPVCGPFLRRLSSNHCYPFRGATNSALKILVNRSIFQTILPLRPATTYPSVEDALVPLDSASRPSGHRPYFLTLRGFTL